MEMERILETVLRLVKQKVIFIILNMIGII